MIGYLKTNHFASKVREIYSEDPINIPCIDEIKLDSSHPDSQSI